MGMFWPPDAPKAVAKRHFAFETATISYEFKALSATRFEPV
jgi:hypothetical protein